MNLDPGLDTDPRCWFSIQTWILPSYLLNRPHWYTHNNNNHFLTTSVAYWWCYIVFWSAFATPGLGDNPSFSKLKEIPCTAHICIALETCFTALDIINRPWLARAVVHTMLTSTHLSSPDHPLQSLKCCRNNLSPCNEYNTWQYNSGRWTLYRTFLYLTEIFVLHCSIYSIIITKPGVARTVFQTTL